MTYIFIVYRIYIFIISIWGYLNLRKGKKIITKNRNNLNNEYILLFPAFNEQKITTLTCRYFEQWLKNDKNIEILIIGDINEKDKPTTVDIAKKYFSNSVYKKRFNYLIWDKAKGSKATKVNFAITCLRKKYKNLPHLVVFDFDARPKWEDFVKSDKLISEEKGQVYSFTPMIDSSKSEGILLNSYSVNHLERVLVNELGNHLLIPYLRYPMGATMILSPSLWNFIPLIPEPVDDIPLGYLLAKKGAKCITLPFFTKVLATPDVKSLYRQYIPIYTGVFSRLSTLRQYNIVLTPKDFFIELFCNIFTVFEFIAIFYSLLLLLSFNYIGVLFFLFQVVTNLIILKMLSFKNVFFGLAGYYIRLSLFLNFLWVKLFTKVDLSKYKTPR